jgi:hypothetical protein
MCEEGRTEQKCIRYLYPSGRYPPACEFSDTRPSSELTMDNPSRLVFVGDDSNPVSCISLNVWPNDTVGTLCPPYDTVDRSKKLSPFTLRSGFDRGAEYLDQLFDVFVATLDPNELNGFTKLASQCLPFASMNLGSERREMTQRPRLISADTQRPNHAML